MQMIHIVLESCFYILIHILLDFLSHYNDIYCLLIGYTVYNGIYCLLIGYWSFTKKTIMVKTLSAGGLIIIRIARYGHRFRNRFQTVFFRFSLNDNLRISDFRFFDLKIVYIKMI